MNPKHPDYQKRDAAQRAIDRAARAARRVASVATVASAVGEMIAPLPALGAEVVERMLPRTKK